MAHPAETGKKILDEINQLIDSDVSSTAKAAAVLQLAEAYAWVTMPGQPHGSSSGSSR